MAILLCIILFFWLVAIAQNLDESTKVRRYVNAEKRRLKLLEEAAKWRRSQKSPFAKTTDNPASLSAAEELAYLRGCIRSNNPKYEEELDETHARVVLDYQHKWDWMVKYGAKFCANMDGWYYFACGRKLIERLSRIDYYRSARNSQICELDEMPELSHICDVYINRLTPQQEPDMGDVICMEGSGGFWFANIVDVIPRIGRGSRWKLKPVYSTEDNPWGWISQDEYKYSVANDVPPVPERYSLGTA